jgi:hypothetical protein
MTSVPSNAPSFQPDAVQPKDVKVEFTQNQVVVTLPDGTKRRVDSLVDDKGNIYSFFNRKYKADVMETITKTLQEEFAKPDVLVQAKDRRIQYIEDDEANISIFFLDLVGISEEQADGHVNADAAKQKEPESHVKNDETQVKTAKDAAPAAAPAKPATPPPVSLEHEENSKQSEASPQSRTPSPSGAAESAASRPRTPSPSVADKTESERSRSASEATHPSASKVVKDPRPFEIIYATAKKELESQPIALQDRTRLLIEKLGLKDVNFITDQESEAAMKLLSDSTKVEMSEKKPAPEIIAQFKAILSKSLVKGLLTGDSQARSLSSMLIGVISRSPSLTIAWEDMLRENPELKKLYAEGEKKFFQKEHRT